MFGISRWNSFDEVFNLHRDVERLFNQVWSEMPLRPSVNASTSPTFPFQVRSSEDGWIVDVPMAGIDPRDVKLEAAGNTLTIRAEVPRDQKDAPVARFEQSLTVPQFVDLEKLTASHRHGMLRLALPLKDSVKPRRIEIQTQHEDQRQLTASNS
ncbi:MAG TPA: Hsp20/alpha crystallin family protein [Vicinamibacterales bacterium]|nr:Hsp20/alpha crystallin family protein [Vicinamibacterales bacterium]